VTKPVPARNPFYLVLIVAGVLFALTAFAYFTMALRQVRSTDELSVGLMSWLDRHGLKALIFELLVLAIATFGAMGTDEYWRRRAEPAADDDLRKDQSSP
jgi:hypothetical protein